VALAVQEHYLPRGAGDSLPTSDAGAVVALAERLELLLSSFADDKHSADQSAAFARAHCDLYTQTLVNSCSATCARKPRTRHAAVATLKNNGFTEDASAALQGCPMSTAE
jgi:hypothetical protein